MTYFLASAILVHKALTLTMANPTALSSYRQKLPAKAKARYMDNLTLIGGVDPFCISKNDCVSCPLPPVDASEIVSYLVLQTSFVMVKQFIAHKSKERYNQFVCGWVKDVEAIKIGEKCIITGRVSLLPAVQLAAILAGLLI